MEPICNRVGCCQSAGRQLDGQQWRMCSSLEPRGATASSFRPPPPAFGLEASGERKEDRRADWQTNDQRPKTKEQPPGAPARIWARARKVGSPLVSPACQLVPLSVHLFRRLNRLQSNWLGPAGGKRAQKTTATPPKTVGPEPASRRRNSNSDCNSNFNQTKRRRRRRRRPGQLEFAGWWLQ